MASVRRTASAQKREIGSVGAKRELTTSIGVEQRLHVRPCARRRPVHWRELEELVLGPRWEEAEQIAKVRPRLDIAELAARE
jgi:hypothetical protein